MSSSGVIAVSPTGTYNVVVDISDAFGSRATVYSDATRTASVTLPATVTATTEFFVAPGYYTISGKVGGTETLGHRDYVGEGCRNAYNAGVAGSVAAASSGGSTQREAVSIVDGMVPTDVFTALSWNKQFGDTLIALTDPTAPTIVTAGKYAVTVNALADATGLTGKQIYMRLDLDADNDDAIAQQTVALDATIGGSNAHLPPLTVTYYVPAGGVLKFSVDHNAGADVEISGNGSIQRLS